jgi:hypothetical protein
MAQGIRTDHLFGTPLTTIELDNVDPAKLTRIIYSLRDAGFMYSGPTMAGLQTQGNFQLRNRSATPRARACSRCFRRGFAIRSSRSSEPKQTGSVSVSTR